MKTKHTPGPWFVVEGGKNGRWPGGCELAIDDADGGNEERDYYLASVVHGDPDELRANALLVAAAPDLLAALEAVTYIAESVAHLRGLERDILPATDAARAAINKATGGN